MLSSLISDFLPKGTDNSFRLSAEIAPSPPSSAPDSAPTDAAPLLLTPLEEEEPGGGEEGAETKPPAVIRAPPSPIPRSSVELELFSAASNPLDSAISADSAKEIAAKEEEEEEVRR